MPTHYETLGIADGAEIEEVKAAFRRLARELHPDVNQAADAKERFQGLQHAYEALSDPRRKAAYDALLGVQRQAQADAARDEAQRRKAEAEAEELRRRAEERMRDAPPPPRIDLEETQRLTRLLNGGRLVEAERLAVQMLLDEPRQPVPYAVLGDVARLRGEFERAAQNYGYAAQYEPRNPVYQRKYEEMLSAQSDSPVRRSSDRYVPELEGRPLAVGGFLVTLMAVYVAISPERPLGIAFAPAWTLGTLGMLFLAGVVAGTSLSLAGALARFDASTGSAMMRVSPATALGIVSLVSFWAACAVYFVVGQTQRAFNRSVSLHLGSVAILTIMFTLAGLAKGPDVAAQNLIWGGNLTYFGGLAGWFVTDSLRAR